MSSPGCVCARSGDRIGPGTTPLTRRLGVVFPFVGEDREQRRQAGLGDRIGAPERFGILAARVQREHDARVRGGAQQRQQRAGQAERREQIDAQRREPGIEGLVLDRSERAELHGGVHDRVDPAVLRLQRARDVGEILGRARWRDRAAGSSARDDRQRRSRRRALRACARRARAGRRSRPAPRRRAQERARARRSPR